MDNKSTIKLIKKHGKSYSGKTNLINFLEGKHITRKEAISAYCYDCQGYCEDGRVECEQLQCPLYSYSQFNKYNINKSDKE
jgi:hypothetical protein